MNRVLYSIAWWAATPLVAAYLLWRARRQPEYLSHWAERWGFYRSRPETAAPLIWVHAVSVGETRAAAPLVFGLLSRYPEHHVVLTHGTPTGRATGMELFAKQAHRVTSVYLPYDYHGATRRFFSFFRPRLGLILETEVWPNLMHAARERQIPVVLVNARLSEKSLAKARKNFALIKPALDSFHAVFAQTPDDARRIASLGVQARVFGNMKFDQPLDAASKQTGEAWKKTLGNRFVILLASSRETEEQMILKALLLEPAFDPSRHLLVIVPRHPQRFDDVAQQIADAGRTAVRRSTTGWPDTLRTAPGNCIVLGDSMGEMQSYYALADVVIMGGTFGGTGGQNLIEACALGCPVLLGPSTYNFAQAAQQALAAGAAKQVTDAGAALNEALFLAEHAQARESASASALAFSRAHQGALALTLQALGPLFTDSRSA